MRALAVVAVALFALAAMPTAPANLVYQDTFPVKGSHFFMPQMHCEFVMDSGGERGCVITDKVAYVTHIRARVVGTASVLAFVDIPGPYPGTFTQVARLECTKSCEYAFYTPAQNVEATLNVRVISPPGAFVSVDVENHAPGTTLP